MNYCFNIRQLPIALLFFSFSLLYAQSESEMLRLAVDKYKRQDYFEASKYFKAAWNKIEKDKTYLIDAGSSAYKANDLDFAIRCFEKALVVGDPIDKVANWNLAKCYQHKYKFEEAIVQYKNYLKAVKNNDAQKSFVKNELLRCESGIKLNRRQPLAIVESIGSSINTSLDEFAPVPDPKNNTGYYISAVRENNTGGKRNSQGLNDTEQGRWRSDIFYMKQTNGSWSLNRLSEPELNSNMEDRILAVAENGTVLVFYRSWNDDQGTILTDSLDHKNSKLNYSLFNGPMIAEIGDHSACIFQDSLLLFSSCRAGGYGAYDLYFSVKRNSTWSRPVNLGPKINTPFNEENPFLAKDGLTLYFSSDNLHSIGGFDIFKSRYQPEAQQWSEPQNLGIPINSAGNDLYFRLSNDGLAGIFSSDRKIDNLGGQDIYLCYFKGELTEQLTEAKGSALNSIVDIESSGNENSILGREDELLAENLKKEERKNYFIEPVYYNEENFINESKTQKNLDKLVAMMQVQSDLKIQFIGHSYEDSQDPVNLYFSIKKAEELEKYLVDKKIAKQRISCIGVGSSLPVANVKINGIKSVAAEKLNKRIETNVLQVDSNRLKINYASIPVPTALKSERQESFRIWRTGLTYSIYLGESASILNHPLVRFSEGVVFVEKNGDESRYKYYFGIYKSFKSAEADMIRYQSQYKLHLDLKAFDSGIELSRKEIIDHVLQDEDLLLYLNYLNRLEK